MIHIDADSGRLSVDADLSERPARAVDLTANHSGMGRELFAAFRHNVNAAEQGASIFGGE